MDYNVYVQLISMCVVNIIFTFSGIVLNTLVIASILKSSQLRKKLCHFMIMVLSCVDLASLVSNHPGVLLYLIFWLREDYYLLPKIKMYLHFVNVFLGFSLYALLVMNIERYLGAFHPIFHRTSVTRRRLLTLLAVLLIFQTTLYAMSTKDMVIFTTLFIIICIIIVFPPLVFINFKLFKISRQVCQGKATPPRNRTTICLKSISTCLLAVACLVVMYIPSSLYIVFNVNTENKHSTNARLSRLWSITTFTMNCTFNSLVFFWKNKVLRTEGIKILKALKDRHVGS